MATSSQPSPTHSAWAVVQRRQVAPPLLLLRLMVRVGAAPRAVAGVNSWYEDCGMTTAMMTAMMRMATMTTARLCRSRQCTTCCLRRATTRHAQMQKSCAHTSASTSSAAHPVCCLVHRPDPLVWLFYILSFVSCFVLLLLLLLRSLQPYQPHLHPAQRGAKQQRGSRARTRQLDACRSTRA